MHRNLFLFMLCLGTALFFSCNRHVAKTESPEYVFYPSPPDTVRIQFLVSYGDSEDFTGPPPKFRTFVAGKPAPVGIRKPYGLAVDRERLYIADPGSAGIMVAGFEDKNFRLFTPMDRGRLKFPVNCNADEEGNLYVADTERRQVVIFDGDLNYMSEIGGDEGFRPTDVAVHGDKVFVADSRNNRISVHDRDSGELRFAFPKGAAVGDEQWLYNPINLCVEGDRLFVTDFGHSRIKEFNLEGEYLRSIGSYGRGLGQFARPKGIALDRDGNLYVVDAGFDNVQVFDKEGHLLMFFGGPGNLNLPANVCIDYDNTGYFEEYVAPGYRIDYLIFVSSQYGPNKVNVYGRIVPGNL